MTAPVGGEVAPAAAGPAAGPAAQEMPGVVDARTNEEMPGVQSAGTVGEQREPVEWGKEDTSNVPEWGHEDEWRREQAKRAERERQERLDEIERQRKEAEGQPGPTPGEGQQNDGGDTIEDVKEQVRGAVVSEQQSTIANVRALGQLLLAQAAALRAAAGRNPNENGHHTQHLLKAAAYLEAAEVALSDEVGAAVLAAYELAGSFLDS